MSSQRVRAKRKSVEAQETETEDVERDVHNPGVLRGASRSRTYRTYGVAGGPGHDRLLVSFWMSNMYRK